MSNPVEIFIRLRSRKRLKLLQTHQARLGRKKPRKAVFSRKEWLTGRRWVDGGDVFTAVLQRAGRADSSDRRPCTLTGRSAPPAGRVTGGDLRSRRRARPGVLWAVASGGRREPPLCDRPADGDRPTRDRLSDRWLYQPAKCCRTLEPCWPALIT